MKKIICILISIILSGSFLHVLAFYDVEKTVYEDSISFVTAFGIMKGKSDLSFAPNENLTRAEAAAILLRMLNLGENTVSQNALFSDVPLSHWAYDYVNYAFQLGLIKGVSDTEFCPDDFVTLEQAAKMMVCVTGYEVAAESLGGFPTGYISEAAQLGILKGVSGDKIVGRGSMARLIKNTMEVSLFKKVNYGTDKAVYSVDSEATLLSEYHHIKKYEGRVTATYSMRMEDDSPELKKDEIAVGDTVFAVRANAESLFAKQLVIYSKTENYRETVIYYEEKKSEHVMILDADSILPKTNINTIYYDDGKGNIKDVFIGGAVVVYNGKPTALTDESLLFPSEGSIKLISSGGTSAFAVIIKDYKVYVVDRRYPDENKIYFKDGTFIELDDFETIKFENSLGFEENINSCQEWDVLCVAVSKDGELADIIRSDKKVEGTVEELSGEDLKIEGKSYKFSAKDITLGLNAVFCLSPFGKIVFYKRDVDPGKKYGYFLGSEVTKGLDQTPRFKIYSDDGVMGVYNIAERVRFICNQYNTDSICNKKNFYELYILRGYNKEQLIMFQLNAQREICLVETALPLGDESQNREKVFSYDFYENGKSQFIGYDMNMFAAKYSVTANTKIFYIPSKYPGSDKPYNMLNMSELIHGSSSSYFNLEFYDINENYEIGALIIRNESGESGGSVGTGTEQAVVLSISKITDEDGMPCNMLYLYARDQGRISLIIPDESEIFFGKQVITSEPKKAAIATADLKPGDVIQFEKNALGEISRGQVLLRINTPVISQNVTGTDGISATWDVANLNCIYGEVAKVFSYGILCYIPNSLKTETYERVQVFKGAVILLFDKSKNTISKIDGSEIRIGDMVYASKQVAFQKMIVVYR